MTSFLPSLVNNYNLYPLYHFAYTHVATYIVPECLALGGGKKQQNPSNTFILSSALWLSPSRPAFTFLRLLGLMEVRVGLSATDLRRLIVDHSKRGRHVLVTGAAGTGKTHTLGLVLQTLHQRNMPHLTTGTTGVSATMHKRARTLHSTLRLPVHRTNDAPWSTESFSRYFGKLMYSMDESVLELIRTPGFVLVVEEVSMLSGKTFDAMQIAMGVYNRNRAFTYVWCGDFCQLPPVNGTMLTQHAPFRSLLSQTTVVHLTKNYRSKDDPAFQACMNGMRLQTIPSGPSMLEALTRAGVQLVTMNVTPEQVEVDVGLPPLNVRTGRPATAHASSRSILYVYETRYEVKETNDLYQALYHTHHPADLARSCLVQRTNLPTVLIDLVDAYYGYDELAMNTWEVEEELRKMAQDDMYSQWLLNQPTRAQAYLSRAPASREDMLRQLRWRRLQHTVSPPAVSEDSPNRPVLMRMMRALRESLQQDLPNGCSPRDLLTEPIHQSFALGQTVMHTRNLRSLVNGDVGVVVAIDHCRGWIKVNWQRDTVVTCRRDTIDIDKGEDLALLDDRWVKPVGTAIHEADKAFKSPPYFPLVPFCAITAHRIQGITLYHQQLYFKPRYRDLQSLCRCVGSHYTVFSRARLAAQLWVECTYGGEYAQHKHSVEFYQQLEQHRVLERKCSAASVALKQWRHSATPHDAQKLSMPMQRKLSLQSMRRARQAELQPNRVRLSVPSLPVQAAPTSVLANGLVSRRAWNATPVPVHRKLPPVSQRPNLPRWVTRARQWAAPRAPSAAAHTGVSTCVDHNVNVRKVSEASEARVVAASSGGGSGSSGGGSDSNRRHRRARTIVVTSASHAHGQRTTRTNVSTTQFEVHARARPASDGQRSRPPPRQPRPPHRQRYQPQRQQEPHGSHGSHSSRLSACLSTRKRRAPGTTHERSHRSVAGRASKRQRQ